jgi:hypothetical protein
MQTDELWGAQAAGLLATAASRRGLFVIVHALNGPAAMSDLQA